MVAQPSPGRSSPPLSIEPVIGWRLWCIEWDGEDRVSLTSPMQDYDWRPMEPNRARCRSHFGKQLPNVRCGCGLYAVSRLGRLPMAVGPSSNLSIGAVGSVAMWGRVVEHAAGYRGQLAYPDRIRLVCGRCLLAGRDGVPTRIEHVDGVRAEPVCDSHATPGRSTTRPIAPLQLQQMVLSAYAVDLLPVEALHKAGYRRGPVPPAGLVAAARSEFRQLTRSRSGVLAVALLVVAFLGLRGLGLFGSPGVRDVPEEVAPVDPVAVQERFFDDADRRPPLELVHPAPERRSTVFRFGAVCGHRIGGHVRVMACGRPRAELFGFYTSPPEPRRECALGDAYSRKPDFSVCWLDIADGFGPGLEFLRLPGVHRWDLES